MNAEQIARHRDSIEEVHGNEIAIGDLIWVSGFLWVVDAIAFEPNFGPIYPYGRHEGRHLFTTHWAGIGRNPKFFNDDFTTAHVDSIKWTRVKAKHAEEIRGVVRAKGGEVLC